MNLFIPSRHGDRGPATRSSSSVNGARTAARSSLTETLPRPADGAPAPRPHRPPQAIRLTLSDADAHALPRRIPALLSQTDVREGDAVTVDLASAASVHLTGLELLLTVLWRRVGPSGDVTLSGGTPGVHAQLSSVGITPAAARAGVYGPPPRAPLPRMPAADPVAHRSARSHLQPA